MKLTFKLLQDTIHGASVKVVSQRTKHFKKGELSEPGKAKIRYVGCMCVTKCCKHLCNILRENLGDPHHKAKDKVSNAKKTAQFYLQFRGFL